MPTIFRIPKSIYHHGGGVYKIGDVLVIAVFKNTCGINMFYDGGLYYGVRKSSCNEKELTGNLK